MKHLTYCTSLLLVLLIASVPADLLATPKRKICHPAICIKKGESRKTDQIMRKLPRGTHLVSEPKRVPIEGEFTEFPPPPGTATPLGLKVPANRSIQTLCDFLGGRLECYSAVTQAECPKQIRVQSGPGSTYYLCDMDCFPPDSNGDCDCEILYESCLPLG